MEDFLIKALQFILSISILVVLHELGHFIPAKIFKTRVEKFYLFFDPWFSVFKKKIKGTEYGIGWLPLGGYVKISGMIDESMDKEQMKEPPKPHEFRSKPAWQRLIIMIGGVTVNVLLAFFIYAMMLFAWGEEYLPVENAVYGVQADSLMLENGFRNGDKILAVGGEKPQTFTDVNRLLVVKGATDVTVERNGETLQVALPADFNQQMLAENIKMAFTPRFPSLIDSVIPGSAAANAGLQKGDHIVAVDGKESQYFYDLQRMLSRYAGQKIELTIVRDKNLKTVPADISEDGTLGFYTINPYTLLETEKREYGFFESFPAGIREGVGNLTNYVSSLSLLFSEEGVKQVGGFLTIGKLFDDQWNWKRFWNMTALLSIILAVMNILPIPALDGGHVLFLLFEMVAGRPPGQKFMEYAQLAGMAILLTLLLWANGMDIFRYFTQ